MSRLARREARTRGGATVRISGKTVNLYYARIVYRCEECLGDLELRNAGLVCKADHNHKGFIHRDDATIAAASRAKKAEAVQENYNIIGGKLVYKGDNHGD